MARIVAFAVANREEGVVASDRLEDIAGVDDVAVVFRNDKGKVRIRQSGDATLGKDAIRGGLLGGVVSIFAGPLVGMAAAGAAAGGIYGALRDKGVSDKLMRLAGGQLEAGQAAVFVLADDATADAIEAKIREVADGEIAVGSFDADAQRLVREELKLIGG